MHLELAALRIFSVAIFYQPPTRRSRAAARSRHVGKDAGIVASTPLVYLLTQEPNMQLSEHRYQPPTSDRENELIYMATNEDEINEYLDLPDDPEEAFATLQRRKYRELEEIWNNDQGRGGWYNERKYVDALLAFDEVHDLGILAEYRISPTRDNEFSDFFQDFRRQAEIASQKILIETARRLKSDAQSVVLLDASARSAIHALINAIREKLNEIEISEDKRESLFNKLNSFASEVDRNRTRTQAFFAFAVEAARTAKTVNDEIKPLAQTIDRIFDLLEKAKKWKDVFPPWSERKRIEGPRKTLPPPEFPNDDIPF